MLPTDLRTDGQTDQVSARGVFIISSLGDETHVHTLYIYWEYILHITPHNTTTRLVMSTRSFFVVVVHASMVQISFYMYLHIVQVQVQVQVCYKSHPGSLTYYTKGAIMTKGIISNKNLE